MRRTENRPAGVVLDRLAFAGVREGSPNAAHRCLLGPERTRCGRSSTVGQCGPELITVDNRQHAVPERDQQYPQWFVQGRDHSALLARVIVCRTSAMIRASAAARAWC